MKTEFQFMFSTYDFFFSKEHKYIGSVGSPAEFEGSEHDMSIDELEIRIVPNDDKYRPGVSQQGDLFIMLPLEPEIAKERIMHLLHMIVEKINFNNQGKFEIFGGMWFGKRIPENEEEEKSIGDAPYFAEMRIVEDIGEPEFDSTAFANSSSKTNDMALVQQHNHASNAGHPIDKFVSYYKIIEDKLYSNKRVDAKELLRKSEILKEIFESGEIEGLSFDKFVNDIVDIRHKCSHLKRNSNFGYVLNDERINSEVNMYLNVMEYVTRELVLSESSVT